MLGSSDEIVAKQEGARAPRAPTRPASDPQRNTRHRHGDFLLGRSTIRFDDRRERAIRLDDRRESVPTLQSQTPERFKAFSGANISRQYFKSIHGTDRILPPPRSRRSTVPQRRRDYGNLRGLRARSHCLRERSTRCLSPGSDTETSDVSPRETRVASECALPPRTRAPPDTPPC